MSALHAPQRFRRTIELDCAVKPAGRQRGLEFGRQVNYVPAQAVLRACALGHEILAVVGEQPDLQRCLVQMGDREALDAFLQHRAGDRPRVDLIGLARLALAQAG
jgi:hypothetical protein